MFLASVLIKLVINSVHIMFLQINRRLNINLDLYHPYFKKKTWQYFLKNIYFIQIKRSVKYCGQCSSKVVVENCRQYYTTHLSHKFHTQKGKSAYLSEIKLIIFTICTFGKSFKVIKTIIKDIKT